MKESTLTGVIIAGGIGLSALAVLAQSLNADARLTRDRFYSSLAETRVANIGFTISVPSLSGELHNVVTPSVWTVGQGFDVGDIATGTYVNTSNFGANFRARIIDMDTFPPNNIVCQQEALVWLEPSLSTNFVLPGALFAPVMPNHNWNLLLELLMYT